MKNLLLISLLFYVTLGVVAVYAENMPLPSPMTEKHGEEKSTIFLLGNEPNDDILKNGKFDVDSAGNKPSAQSFTAGIGDTVVVHLCDKDKSLINNANCIGSDGKDKKDCTKRNISIYLDGRSIGERKYNELLNGNRIEFKLAYLDNKDFSNKQKWQELLGSPTWGKNFFKKPVNVTVGLANTANQSDLVTINSSDKFYLQRISFSKFIAGLVILFCIIVAIVKLAPNSGLLRNGDETTQWSLARCQMAFWFILIIYSFLFVWGITGAMDTITSQTLVMMGLSSGTLLGAALIDVTRDDNKRLEEMATSIQKYNTDNIALNNQLSQSPANSALTVLRDENERRIKALNDEILRLKNADKKSGHFWKDIISDRTGCPALHRFQIAAWTIVLGFIFVFSVWKDLSMPAFSDTLLALMGLSSVTYLGFKVPENSQ